MKRFDLLTIFPEIFNSYLSQSLVHKALQKNIFSIKIHDLRKWAIPPHRMVDDLPYGGGPGMVYRPEPLTEAIKNIKSHHQNGRVIYLSCRGNLLNQSHVKQLHQNYEEILLVCGRYEGIDERVIESLIDEEISIGDYVLAGGEVPAMVLLDALIRLIPGVIGKENSLIEESFEKGLLEYPHYTRPETYEGMKVPGVLLSGNHAAIRKWRLEEAVKKTIEKRADILEKNDYSEEVQKIIQKWMQK